MQRNKEGNQIRLILSMLIENEILTVKEIAERVNLSEKTVRTRLDHLTDYLIKNHLGTIHRKPRVGVWIEIEENMEKTLFELIHEESEDVVYQKDDRLDNVVSIFLNKPNDSFTLNNLADLMYYSVPTISNTIDEAEEWFARNNIKLRRVTNRGHWLEFDEYDYRVACRNYVVETAGRVEVKKVLKELFVGLDIEKISKIIHSAEEKHDMSLSDMTYIDLMIFSATKVFRNTQGYYVKNINKDTLVQHRTYAFVKEIAENLAKEFRFETSEDEISLLGFQVLFNYNLIRDENDEVSEEHEQLYDLAVTESVDRMVKTISEIIELDLNEDSLLKEGLKLHLKSALLRMKYGYYDNNTQVTEIREKYSSVYKAVWSISMILEDEFGVKMNDNEVAYITLYVQASIERNQEPLRALFVSSKTNAQNQYFIQQLQKHVVGDGYLEFMSLHHVRGMDLKNYDVVLTTDQSSYLERYENVIKIGSTLSEMDIRNLNSFIIQRLTLDHPNRTKDVRAHILFEKDLIIKKKRVNNKEEAIKCLCKVLEKKGYVGKSYYESVIDREKIADTCIGNNVAIPHGSQDMINNSKVAIMVLDEGVNWTSQEKVNIVYLLAIKMKTETDQIITTIFYKEYLNELSEKSSVNDLLKLKDSSETLEYIRR